MSAHNSPLPHTLFLTSAQTVFFSAFFRTYRKHIPLTFSFTQIHTHNSCSLCFVCFFLVPLQALRHSHRPLTLSHTNLFSFSYTHVPKPETYPPDLTKFGYGFNCTYESTAFSIFFSVIFIWDIWESLQALRATARCLEFTSADWFHTVHMYQLHVEHIRVMVQIPEHWTHGTCTDCDSGEKQEQYWKCNVV